MDEITEFGRDLVRSSISRLERNIHDSKHEFWVLINQKKQGMPISNNQLRLKIEEIKQYRQQLKELY